MGIDRSSLPRPLHYYSQVFGQLSRRTGWVKVKCLFHNDKVPSLGVNLDSGHFKCHACDARGGDIIAFVMRLHDCDFKTAIQILEAA